MHHPSIRNDVRAATTSSGDDCNGDQNRSDAGEYPMGAQKLTEANRLLFLLIIGLISVTSRRFPRVRAGP